jgi:hypothetical protein
VEGIAILERTVKFSFFARPGRVAMSEEKVDIRCGTLKTGKGDRSSSRRPRR